MDRAKAMKVLTEASGFDLKYDDVSIGPLIYHACLHAEAPAEEVVKAISVMVGNKDLAFVHRRTGRVRI